MWFVLLSGGSGKRLWPLSNDSQSKQFLQVLDGEDGSPISMLQHIWGKFKARGLQDRCLVATSAEQEIYVKRQLGEDVRIVLEPERMDTFAAIALSVTYLHDVFGVTPDEPIILPV
ncbi:sugar phosphate nucleotidyltransferase [Paenibacillus sp. MBLB4367]|uniref:sugar phosphate nucleotidyltransferase n=1 Tax=Paenibacillus sp. MBLB4367 TaxID=3384767 RepID=UPI003907EFF3